MISVGIPTRNRADVLERAIRSVLDQSVELEILVGDNASTDHTADVVHAFKDERVRYLRHSSDLGALANFASVFNNAKGDFFMWLGDDDWVDPDYLVAASVAIREGIGACGTVVTHSDDRTVLEETMGLTDDSSVRRILRHYQTVSANGLYYSMWRREPLARVDLLEGFGADWLVTGDLAYQGRVIHFDGPRLHRDLGVGRQADAPDMLPYLSIARLLAGHMRSSPIYSNLPAVRRSILAATCGAMIVGRYEPRLAWTRAKSVAKSTLEPIRRGL